MKPLSWIASLGLSHSQLFQLYAWLVVGKQVCVREVVVGVIVNSLSPDHSCFFQHHHLALMYFQIVYFHLQSPPKENRGVCRQGCAITFSSGQYFAQTLLPSPVASFHPTRLPKPCYKDGSFLCCQQGAVC